MLIALLRHTTKFATARKPDRSNYIIIFFAFKLHETVFQSSSIAKILSTSAEVGATLKNIAMAELIANL